MANQLAKEIDHGFVPIGNQPTMSAMDKPVVLYVDDEAGNLAAFNAAFRRDFDVRLAQSADEALEALDQEQVDVMITDQRMPPRPGSIWSGPPKPRIRKW